MNKHPLITQAIENHERGAKTLAWNSKKEGWVVTSEGKQKWEKVQTKPLKLKKLGDWKRQGPLDGEVALGIAALMLITGFIGGVTSWSLGIIFGNAVGTAALWALMPLVLFSAPILVLLDTYSTHFTAKKQSTGDELRLYKIHKLRPHATGIGDEPRFTYAVGVNEQTRAYQLLQYSCETTWDSTGNVISSKLAAHVLLEVPAPTDLIEMTEFGEEMAQVAAYLEEREYKNYLRRLQEHEMQQADEIIAQETNRFQENDIELMKAATGY